MLISSGVQARRAPDAPKAMTEPKGVAVYWARPGVSGCHSPRVSNGLLVLVGIGGSIVSCIGLGGTFIVADQFE